MQMSIGQGKWLSQFLAKYMVKLHFSIYVHRLAKSNFVYELGQYYSHVVYVS